MKYFFFIAGLFLNSFGFGQIQDDFSDGDFTTNPEWLGSTADYIINPTFQLQLNRNVAGTSYLQTSLIANDFNNKEWQLWVKQSFAGSNTNYGRIYLIANSNDLSTNPDGVYIQLGEAGNTDAIRLMQRASGVTTAICSTPDGSIANSFVARIKVTRDATGNWTLYSDMTGGNDLNLASSGVELSIPTGVNFGYLNIYTASNANRFYLDDVYYGDWILDVTAPAISSTTIVTNQSIKVQFSEPVKPSVLQPTNWTFSPAIAVQSIAWSSGINTAVEIQFSNPIGNAINYTYILENLEDLAGNIADPLNGNFIYLLSDVAEVGDVIINEFFPDPSPVIGLPEVEFVEIYNRSNKIFNLRGWKIGDNATFGTINTDKWMMPGDHVVLVATSSVSLFPNAVGVTSWPALNNSTDDVAIVSAEGLQLERFTYTLDWYHDASKVDGGWTIERVNPLTECSSIGNWKASIDESGGTPALRNSVYDLTPDLTPPTITRLSFSTDTLTVLFSEDIVVSSLDISQIQISPNVTISQSSFTGNLNNKLILKLAGVQSNQMYNVSIPTVQDCNGNVSGQLVDSFIFYIAEIAQIGDVIINEFMADPSPVVGLPEVEFVEIYNRSNKVFNLKEWKLGDNSSQGTIGEYWLLPGQYVILTATANVNLFPSNVVAVTSFPSLGNAADDIAIISKEGLELERISYTLNWYQDMSKKDGGWTIERINPISECSSFTNWRASVDVDGGTPGRQNSVFELTIDTTPPSISEIYVSNDTVFVNFNEQVQANNLNATNILTSPAAVLNNIVYSGALTASVQLVYADLQSNVTYRLTMNELTDCAGNTTSLSIDFGVPSPAQIGDVLINEVLFDPNTGGNDWVELYNNSNKWLDLKGWKLGKYTSAGISQVKELTSHYLLEPNQYVVVGSDSTYILNNYPFAVSNVYIQSALPALNSDSSTLYVQFPLNGVDELMDKLSYSKKWHFRLLDNTKGKSLERISFTQATQEPNNWHTAAESVGWGTPGVKNSQYSADEFNGSISFTSDVISPDNDGFEDVLFINYQMEFPDMVATIRIYDDAGREIIKLINNELLAVSGMITWDGIRADGMKAKVGVYVLVMEAYAITGEKYRGKKAFTVATKL